MAGSTTTPTPTPTPTPELQQIRTQVSGNPGTIRQHSATLGTAADQFAGHRQAVSTVRSDTTAGWQGSGAESFHDLMVRFDTASRQVETSLRNASQALAKSAATMENVQHSVDTICKQLHIHLTSLNLQKDAASLKKDLGTLAAIERKVEAAKQKAHGQARQKLAELDAELHHCSTLVSQAYSLAEDTISAVPLPSGSAFTPVLTSYHGHPLSGGTGGLPGGGSGSGGFSGGGSFAGGPIPGATSGSGFQNELTVARYLMSHGYSKAAAAGIASCIDGESAGNPESVGSGGCGLIGWTPPSKLAQYGGTCAAAGIGPGNTTPSQDLASQMRAIVNYNKANGNVGALNSIHNPVQAADYYSQNFERPLVTDSDVRGNVAQAIFAKL